jgi:hypothetical protein
LGLESIPDSFPILTLYLGNFFDTLTGREPESFLSRRLPRTPVHGNERRNAITVARFDDVAVHGSFLRPGVSLRQGMPEVEVAHAK